MDYVPSQAAGAGVDGRAIILRLDAGSVWGFEYAPRSEQPQSTAVLICPPFGWAEVASHRALRTWGRTLAEHGYWSARFDLPSSGDSDGTPRDPGRLDAWTDAVAGAADWLRRRSGASRIAAIGIELGGLLAYRALARSAPIDDLVLWSVPSRGKRLLRELRASGTLIAATYPEDDRPGSMPEGDLQLTGYLLTAETAGALESVDLTTLTLPAGTDRRALILGRDGLPTDARLREHLVSAGTDVTVADGVDYGDMMAHPQQAVAPARTIARTLTWLHERSAAGAAVSVENASRSAVERDRMDTSADGTAVVETPLRLTGHDGAMFGVLSESAQTTEAPLCVVWLNGGMVRRIGPNRTWVECARRWAARGIPVVRLDLGCIGDSDGEFERPLPDAGLYQPEQTEDVLATLDQLVARGLPPRFVLGGLCSGAYWGLHAALADPRVVGLLAINLYCFFWDERLVIERDRRATAGALRHGLVRRLLSGRVQPDQVRRAVRSITARESAGVPRGSVEHAHVPQIEAALDQLRGQGTRLRLLFGDGEPLLGQLERTGVVRRFAHWPNAAIDRIPSRDHMFHQLWLQDHVHALLDQELDRLLARSGGDADVIAVPNQDS